MLDYVALFMIFFLICALAAVIVVVGSLPGKIARRRGHPWPDAVSAASWIGLATGVLWPVAFIWAFLPVPQRSKEAPQPGVETGDLVARIAALEAAVEELRSQSQEGAA
jgi:uncharacterized BrkB/YihY/UPF0761 family membrane protein